MVTGTSSDSNIVIHRQKVRTNYKNQAVSIYSDGLLLPKDQFQRNVLVSADAT